MEAETGVMLPQALEAHGQGCSRQGRTLSCRSQNCEPIIPVALCYPM